eukprot:g12051.t1
MLGIRSPRLLWSLVAGTNASSFAGADPSTHAGTNPSPDSGANPSTHASTNPSPVTGANPSTHAGTNPSPDSGANPSPDSGANPSTHAGTNPSPDSGANPNTHAGTNPGPDSGADPSTHAGTNPGPDSGAIPSTHAGTNPSPDSGANPSTYAGTDPSPIPGANPSTHAGTNPSPDSGANPSPDSGANPSTHAGTNPSPDSGANPSTHAGTNPSPDSGANPSTHAGTNPSPIPGANPSTHAGTNPSPDSGAIPSTYAGTDPSPIPGANRSTHAGTNASPFPGAIPRTNPRALAGANASSFSGAHPWTNARTLAGANTSSFSGANPRTNARALVAANPCSFSRANPRTNPRAVARTNASSFSGANSRTNAMALAGANASPISRADPRTDARAIAVANASSFSRANPRANACSFSGVHPRTYAWAVASSFSGANPRTYTKAVAEANPRTNARALAGANTRPFPGSNPRYQRQGLPLGQAQLRALLSLQVLVAATAAAADAASVLALSGVAITTVSSMLGGTAGAAAPAIVGNPGPAGTTVTVQNPAGAQNTPSVRQPSATVAFVLVAQIQFLATLSLVDSTGAEDSTLSGFTENLRWVNLWPPASLAESLTPTWGFDSPGDDEGPNVQATSTGNISSAVFMGSFILFASLLSGIFIFHLVVASAVEAYWVAKKRAKELYIMKDESQGPPSQLTGRPTTRQIQNDPEAEASEGPIPWGASNDEEEGESGVKRHKTRLNMEKIAECRERSQSAWLHFPHVELVFLLFAFEGAVASQVSALRENASPVVFFLAMAAMLVYPVLMIVMVSRTYVSKIRPADHIVFKPVPDGATSEAQGGSSPSFGAKVRESLKEHQSMFAWANKGQWESVKSEEKDIQRERDWFRIGFEPLFVDFTKKGSWFVVYILVEWAALGVVGVVVDNSVLQLSLFCAMHTLSFLLLVVFRPFANRIINAMGAGLYGTDAVCMAVLAVSADKWKGSPRAKGADSAVMIVQLISLLALIIPIYVDTSFMMIGAIGRKLQKKNTDDADTQPQIDEEERAFTQRYVRRAWARTWCTMLGKNLFACFSDTAAGVNAKKSTYARATASKTGPYPPIDSEDDIHGPEEFPPRRPVGNSVGTVNTPVVVLSPRSEMIGRNATAWGIMWKIPEEYRAPITSTGQNGDEEQEKERDIPVGETSISRHASASGGRWGLNTRGPQAGDLPRRRSSFSSATSTRSVSGAYADRAQNVSTDYDGASGGKDDFNTEAGDFPADGGARTGADSLSLVGSMRDKLRGSILADDLPKRREYMAPAGSTTDGNGDKDEEEEGDLPVGETSGRSHASGRAGSDRWGLKTRGPEAIDLPRRRSDYSPATSTRSMGGAERSQQEPRDHEGTSVGQNNFNAEPGDFPADEGAKKRATSFSLAESMRHKLGGGILADDLPKRRAYMAPATNTTDGNGDEDEEGGVPIGDNSSSSHALARAGVDRCGLKARGPHGIDLPRRRSGFSPARSTSSMDSVDADKNQEEPSDHEGTSVGQNDFNAEPGDVSADGGARTEADSLSLAGSIRHKLGGGIQTNDLPKRRAYMAPTTHAEDGDGDEDQEEERDIPVGETSTSRHASASGGRWGLNTRGPQTSDLPRRRSGFSSATSTRSVSGAYADRAQNVSTDYDGASGRKDDFNTEAGDFPADGGARTGTGSLSLADSLRHKLGGSILADDLPKRREYMATAGSTTDGNGDKDEEEEGDLPVGETSGRSHASGRAGSDRWGLKTRGPQAIDLPRRRSDFSPATSTRSMGGAERSQQEPRDHEGTSIGQNDFNAERDDVFADGSSRTASFSLAESMRHVLGGAVEDDWPRRRQAKVFVSEGGHVLRGVDNSGYRRERAHSDDGGAGGSMTRPSGRDQEGGIGRLKLRSRVPIPDEFPRRHSEYSSQGSTQLVIGNDTTDTQPYSPSGEIGGQRGADGSREQGDLELDDSAPDGTLSTGGASFSLAESMRQVLGGAVEHDLPRRRPTKYPRSAGEQALDDVDHRGEQEEVSDAGSDA